MPRGVRVLAEDALALMRVAGWEPLEPYPGGTTKPWSCRCTTCGAIREPSYQTAKKGHGCSNCSGVGPLSPAHAEARLLEWGARPLEPFTRVDVAWKAECLVCHREINVLLERKNKDFMACIYCSGGKIAPDAAAVAMRAAGWEPLTPFPGAGDPWPSRCLTCGNESRPRYSHLKRGTGCSHCAGNAAYTDAEATAVMREHGLEPLSPYPGNSNTPWPARCVTCASTVSPRFYTVNKRGGGCSECGKRARRISGDAAEAFMNEHGWEPLEPYPGSDTPWRSRCLTCGDTRSPTYSAIRNGGGCGTCSGNGPMNPDIAVARMLKGGARPLAPFTSTLDKWACECLTCGREITPRLNQVTMGFGACGYCAGSRLTDETIAEVMSEAGWEPLETYPGSGTPWKCRCTTCGAVRRPSFNTVRRGNGCGSCHALNMRVDEHTAVQVMHDAGFEPLVPYPGTNEPWASRCVGCGTERTSTYGQVRLGNTGCATCRWQLNLPGHSMGLYVVTNEALGAVKVGVGIVRNSMFPRVTLHTRRGWSEVARWVGLKDARVALGVERLVLGEWERLGLRGHVRRHEMPQGGWSETAPLAAVNVEDLVGLVTVSIGVVADGFGLDNDGTGVDL